MIDDVIAYYEEYISKVLLNYNQDQDCNYVKYFFKSRGKQLDVCQGVKAYTEKSIFVTRSSG